MRLVPDLEWPQHWFRELLHPVQFPAPPAAFHLVAAGPVRLVADLERPAVALALDSSARLRQAVHSPAVAAVVEQRHSTR